MGGGVNGVLPGTGHISGGSSLPDEGSPQSVGGQPGSGKGGSGFSNSDGRSSEGVRENGKVAKGWWGTLTGGVGTVVSGVGALAGGVGAIVSSVGGTVVGMGRAMVGGGGDQDGTTGVDRQSESVPDEHGEDPDIGEMDEDGVVWYDAVDGTEEELGELQEVPPPSRGEVLSGDLSSAMLREGLRLGPRETPKIEKGDGRKVESMNQGFMARAMGTASSMLSWLRSWGAGSESVPEPDSRSVGEVALSQIEKLQIDASHCLDKLNEQVIIATGGTSILTQDPAKIKLDVSTLGLGDHVWRWSETAKASFGEAVKALGWCAAGAGIAYGGSTVSTLVGGGVSGQLASVLGGTYLALSALRDLPGNITDQATIGIIEKSLVEINRLLGQIQQLTLQEQHRQELSEKLGMMTMGRREKIEQLALELEVIDRQVVGRKELAGLESEATRSEPRLTVAIGNGSARSETLSGMARVKQAFSSFFAPVVDGLTRVGRFVGDALGLTSLSVLRKMERSDELSYEKTFSQGLRRLREPSDSLFEKSDGRALLRQHSRRVLNLSDEVPTEPRQVQQRTDQLTRQSELSKPVLCLGENVVRHVRNGSGGAFGTLLVSDQDGGRHVVNSGQPTVRALSHYLDVLARDVGEGNPLDVRVDESGGLVLHDEDRRLYQFLMAAPQAMTPLFTSPVGAGGEWRVATEHSSRMWIDDFSGKLPGGANRLVFENGVEGGKDVLRLRFEHLDRSDLVSSLDNVPDHSMGAQLRKMDMAYHDAYQAPGRKSPDALSDGELVQRYQDSNRRLEVAGEDYEHWPLEHLETRRESILNRLAQEQVQLQRDNDSFALLQNDDQLRVVMSLRV